MKNTAPRIDCGSFILRQPKKNDVNDRLKLGRSAEFVKMCGGSVKNLQPFKKRDLKNWYKKVCKGPCEWVIEYGGKCVGIARLTFHKTDNRASYSIGLFDEKLYGKGFGTRVTSAVLQHAFCTLKLHKVDLRVLEFNQRGIRCYEKCGFIREGLEREGALIDGVYYSDVHMGILEHEYRELIKNQTPGDKK